MSRKAASLLPIPTVASLATGKLKNPRKIEIMALAPSERRKRIPMLNAIASSLAFLTKKGRDRLIFQSSQIFHPLTDQIRERYIDPSSLATIHLRLIVQD
jgi:hypothetical protein